jgi:hypothetical protein
MNAKQRYLIVQHRIDMAEHARCGDVEGAYNLTLDFLKTLTNTDAKLQVESDEEFEKWLNEIN